MSETRFDKWSPLVPKTGDVIQLKIDGKTFETTVLGRGTEDQETFLIWVSTP